MQRREKDIEQTTVSKTGETDTESWVTRAEQRVWKQEMPQELAPG